MPNALCEIRDRLNVSQTVMGGLIGLSLRAYQDAEASDAPRKGHVMAAELAALRLAVERGQPMLAGPEVRGLALRLAGKLDGSQA